MSGRRVRSSTSVICAPLFEITDGLWGELAAGQHAAAGRATTARDPGRRKSGRIVSGAATGARTDEWLSAAHRLAKVVTNAVVNRWGDGPDTPAGVRRRLAREGSPEVAAVLDRVSDDTIAAAIRGVRTLQRRWVATPAGGSLRLSWPLPNSVLEEDCEPN
jgi:hypothetical protein